MKTAAKDFSINRICVSAHGAAAALVNPSLPHTGLALPILDYEWGGVNQYDKEYSALRPQFNDSYSPNLPLGLNLGRQLYWLSKKHPTEFNAATYILPLAQYWTWRLCGVAANEVSTMGCHTDLWHPKRNDYSSLVYSQNWQWKFPPLDPAWKVLGNINPAISDETGISRNCSVMTGAHDSNASFAQFLKLDKNECEALVSTGTWAITLKRNGNLNDLDEHLDMLANVDVTGEPVCCARFMGGREYEEICLKFGSGLNDTCSLEDIQGTIDDNVLALPDFSNGSGPFVGRAPQIMGTPKSAVALATLYAALMIDFELDLLKVSGAVIIEGSFVKNDFICSLVASLRPEQEIKTLNNDDGVTQGCLSLATWEQTKSSPPNTMHCHALELNNLFLYRNLWRKLCENEKDLQHA